MFSWLKKRPVQHERYEVWVIGPDGARLHLSTDDGTRATRQYIMLSAMLPDRLVSIMGAGKLLAI